ncbi:MAG: cation:proton antiporter [Candidatus Daviesbacteria bacterium]|nr:cation:proton antiporter [Candidatus Daviesbacteria bacterium]
MNNLFLQLALILGLSSVFGYIVRLFKLPLLIAYLFVGLLLAASAAFDVRASAALSFLPEIGVAFMLFLVGMELDLREIKNLGKPILISGILQVIITSIIGSIIAKYFGFNAIESWYLGIGLSFSSTVLVVKLLLDKKDLTSLYGKLSVGILLLEDFLAVMILLGLTASQSVLKLGLQEQLPIATFLIKVIALFAVAYLLNRFLLPKLFKAVSDSGELLFLTALAWCFIFVSFSTSLGFSVLIGAFLAGVALASSPYHLHIQGKIKPLRDFFLALFFVYLGTQVNFSYLQSTYPLIIIFSLYALFVKPTIFLLVFGIFGFRKHTMFQTALNLSQVSEFSLILVVVGLEKAIVSPSTLTVIALTGVLTMVVSSLMITHGKRIYKLVSRGVAFFERENYRHFMENVSTEDLTGHVILIGGHQVGGEIVKLFKKEKIPQIVLDFNPHLVQSLLELHVPVVYGDMGDPDVLDALNLNEARMIISTAPNFDDNKLLLEELKTRHINIPTVVRAETVQEAESLYKGGADYVIVPEILAGDSLVEKLKDHLSGKYFEDRKEIEREKLSKKTLAWEGN